MLAKGASRLSGDKSLPPPDSAAATLPPSRGSRPRTASDPLSSDSAPTASLSMPGGFPSSTERSQSDIFVRGFGGFGGRRCGRRGFGGHPFGRCSAFYNTQAQIAHPTMAARGPFLHRTRSLDSISSSDSSSSSSSEDDNDRRRDASTGETRLAHAERRAQRRAVRRERKEARREKRAERQKRRANRKAQRRAKKVFKFLATFPIEAQIARRGIGPIPGVEDLVELGVGLVRGRAEDDGYYRLIVSNLRATS